jgi:sugar/nucleoside kinase (ribokinase family)
MKIVGAGLVTADIILACDSSWFQLAIPEYTSGGTVTNVLTHLGYQKWDCHLVGGVGMGDLGSLVCNRLKQFNVNIDSLIIRQTVSTRRFGHLVAVKGPKKGEHRFVERCPKCDKEFPPFDVINADELRSYPIFDSNIVLFIDRANPLTVRLTKDAKNAGSTVIFEPGYLSRDRDTVQQVLDRTDILKYSQDLLFENRPFSEHAFSSPEGAKLIIETRSERGVVIRSMSRRSRLRLTVTPLMNAVDRAGAGDAFMAGFLHGLGDEGIADVGAIDERKLEEAVQRGQALGALACLYIGSTSLLENLSLTELNNAIDLTIEKRKIPPELINSNTVEEWLRTHQLTDVNKQFEGDSKCSLCKLPDKKNE